MFVLMFDGTNDVKCQNLPLQLDDGWLESVQEHSERYKYEDLIT